MDAFLQDIRFAVRALRHTPAFSLTAVLVLALGVGTTTAVFTVVNAVLIRPLPYPDPDRLLAVSSVYQPTQANQERPVVSLTDVERWRQATRTLESVGAFAYTELPIRVADQAFFPITALMDPEFLRTLGITPAMGTLFASREEQPFDNTVIISHRLWAEAFGSDPSVVGRTLSVDGQPYTVRGVLDADFQFPRSDASYFTKPIELLLPAATFPAFPADSRQWFGIARLRAGVSLARAQAEMTAVARELGQTVPADQDWSVRLAALAEVTARGSRPALLIVLAISLVLLAIAATNVMNLLFSRGAARLHESAIRKAIGCSTVRLVRQLLTESACLAAVAGAVGVLLATAGANALVALSPVHLPVTQHIGVDRTVLLFAIAVCALTALVAGIVPALHASAMSDQVVRSPGTRATAGRGLGQVQQALCVAQIALGVGLLSASAALTTGLWGLRTTDPGFRTDSILGFSLSVPSEHSLDQRRRFYQDALNQVRSIPGVESAGFITFLPPETRAGVFMQLTLADAGPLPRGAPPQVANHLITSPDYFRTMSMRLARGRDFTPADGQNAPPVIIVNEALERRYFPGTGAVGRRIGTAFDGGQPVREIVGVVADTHDRGLNREAFPTAYIPFQQFALPYGSIALRTRAPSTTIVPEVRRRLTRLDPAIPLTDFQTVRDRLSESLDEPRFYTLMAGACAALALLFVTLGLYGIVSFSVSRRTPEFGIRIAIGAKEGTILRLVLLQGLRMTGVGVAIGLALSVALARVLGALPFPVGPLGALTLGPAVGVVLAVTLVASLVPAQRASRVSPLAALRYD